jgi:hypothetical protein
MNKIIFILIVSITTFSCKPTQVQFDPSVLNKDYIKQMLIVGRQAKAENISGGEIFMAQLTDKFVGRDTIAQKTIMNEYSQKESLSIPLSDKSYKLFVITVSGIGFRDNAIFIPTTFNANNQCIGIGPALLGAFGPGELVFTKKLKYCRKKKEWEYDKKESDFGKHGIHDPNDPSKTKLNIIFHSDKEDEFINMAEFRIKEILQVNDNKIGENRPLIFNISSVFEDAEALYFKFFRNF